MKATEDLKQEHNGIKQMLNILGKINSDIIAENYINLPIRHIDKEDIILYPLADSRLSKERQTAMPKEFEKIETERIGAGKHEEFHRLLHNLKQIYLAD